MKKNQPSQKTQRTFRTLSHGQSMVLVGLLLVVLIGMLALILDGGYAFLQRRAAQTAADAGALAGATVYCHTHDIDQALNAAYDYAVGRNEAIEADVVFNEGSIEVTTRIPMTTFFGQVLGEPTMTASAFASARCVPPGAAEGILPIAWNCPPEDMYMGPIGFPTCSMQFGPGEPYIIMNSRKTGEENPYCLSEGGSVDCDLDGDGVDEVLAGGDRSWLDLSGSGSDAGDGSAELVFWIENGFPNKVRIHTWFAGQPGVSNNVFMSVYSIVGNEVLLPVYNAIVDGAPPDPYDSPDDTIVWSSGASTTYYHVISFSIFVPTCVHARGSDRCPIYDDLRAIGALSPDDKTIEGYFIEGTSDGLSGIGEVYAGAYTIYLER
jgi:hypothetical protein